MTFRGWPDAAIDFYDGLEEDNSKAYWQKHKATYETAVKGPFEELLAELADEFGPGKLFRPYRDVRFSADKSPYKTNAAATVGAGYVQLSAAGLAVASGMYMMSSGQLQRHRRAIDADPSGAQLLELVAQARRQGLEVTCHESLKSAPRGYANDHPRIDLLRMKGLIVWKEWPVEAWLSTPKAARRVVDVLRKGAPLNAWLDTHVGPPSLD